MLGWLVATLRKEFEVVASVNTGLAALDVVARLDPDVVVLDLAMSPMNGLEVTKTLRRSGARAGIVLVSAYDDPELTKVGFASGAQGFVTKSRVIEELIPAVRKAASINRHSAAGDP